MSCCQVEKYAGDIEETGVKGLGREEGGQKKKKTNLTSNLRMVSIGRGS